MNCRLDYSRRFRAPHVGAALTLVDGLPDGQTMFKPATRRRFAPRPACSTRRAAVTLEFIVALPVLLIVLLAVVEFGMFFSGIQQVNLASRVGAEAASQSTSLPYALTTVPPDVADPINQQLANAGISPCKIILEHNKSSLQTLTTPYGAGCDCDPPATSLPVIAASSVRVTVCVPMSELAPNCLTMFGFDLAIRYAQCSTTFRYELSTP
jgi:Flp pilus assembly protein TadG